MKPKVLQIGTRGSELALTQTQMVIDAFSEKSVSAQKCIIKTRGDKDQRPFTQISGDGFFTKELERAILSNEVDFAVHSAKDLPSIIHEALPWKAFSHREDTCDILIAQSSALDGGGHVRAGMRIGTSSPRRTLQIEANMKNVKIEQLRGNVPTRIQKVVTGELDGVILAKAGVLRLGLLEKVKAQGLVVHDLDFVTAPCQGIIGVQCNQSQTQNLDLIANHKLDQIAKAEKSILSLLGGGCHLPLGAQIQSLADHYNLDFFLGGRSESISMKIQAPTLGSLLRDLVKQLVQTPQNPTHRVWLAQPIQHILKPASFAAHLGIEPIAWPLLEVSPTWKEQDLLAFAQEQKHYGAVSFSSQFAVQIFMTELEAYIDLKRWLESVKIFAVGPATKKKLAEYDITDVEMASEAHGRALAALLDKSRIRGDVLIPGQAGSLVKRRLNAHTKGLTLYRMRPSQQPMSVETPHVQKNDHLVLTSPSAAKEFVLRCQKNAELKRLNIWAFGPSTSRELGFLGIQHRVNPVSGSWESVLNDIKKS